MSDEHETPKGDFIASIVLLLFSGWVIILALGMRRFQPWGLIASPGLSPLVFGSLLFLCSLIMFVRSIRQAGYRFSVSTASAQAFFKLLETRHFLVVLASIFVFYFLLGVIHFAILGSIYIFFIIWYFKGVPWWKNLIISVLSSTVIWFSFVHLFLIPLP